VLEWSILKFANEYTGSKEVFPEFTEFNDNDSDYAVNERAAGVQTSSSLCSTVGKPCIGPVIEVESGARKCPYNVTTCSRHGGTFPNGDIKSLSCALCAGDARRLASDTKAARGESEYSQVQLEDMGVSLSIAGHDVTVAAAPPLPPAPLPALESTSGSMATIGMGVGGAGIGGGGGRMDALDRYLMRPLDNCTPTSLDPVASSCSGATIGEGGGRGGGGKGGGAGEERGDLSGSDSVTGERYSGTIGGVSEGVRCVMCPTLTPS
jgi:hypothetical protein